MRGRRRFCCAVALAASMTARFASATDYHWNVANGTWNNGPNWNPFGEPMTNDNAYIDFASNATAHVIGTPPVCSTVTISNGDTLSVEHNGISNGVLDTNSISVGTLGTFGRLNVLPGDPLRVSGVGYVIDGGMAIGNSSSGEVNQSGGTVSLSSNISIGITPNGPCSYNLSGGTFNAFKMFIPATSSQFPCSFNVSSSAVASMLQITVGINGAVNQSGGQVGVSLVSVSGSFHLSGGTFSTPSTSVFGTVSYDGGTLSFGSLQVSSGGQIRLGSGGGKVLRATTLSIGTTSGGAFNSGIDLGDNAMLVDYTGASPLASIATAIHTGTWDSFNNIAHGIISSAAIIGGGVKTIGYGEASTLGISTFEGYSVDSTTVVVRYTDPGDANLDGTVNALDFAALAANFGAGGKTWTQGDFNSDGIANTLDFTLLARNFNDVLPAPALGTTVPEPLLGGVVVALVTKRRKRKTGQVECRRARR